MASLKELLGSKNFGEYLTTHSEDTALLDALYDLPTENAMVIISSLVDTKMKYDFILLISNLISYELTHFNSNYLQVDSFGYLLVRELVIRIDGSKLKSLSNIDGYQPNNDVREVLARILYLTNLDNNLYHSDLQELFPLRILTLLTWISCETKPSSERENIILLEKHYTQKSQLKDSSFKAWCDRWVLERFGHSSKENLIFEQRLSMLEEYQQALKSLETYISDEGKSVKRLGPFRITRSVAYIDGVAYGVPYWMSQYMDKLQKVKNQDPGLVEVWARLRIQATNMRNSHRELTSFESDFLTKLISYPHGDSRAELMSRTSFQQLV